MFPAHSSHIGLGDSHHHNKNKKRFRDDFVYPTGGNIHDPLNLNSVTPGTVSYKVIFIVDHVHLGGSSSEKTERSPP